MRDGTEPAPPASLAALRALCLHLPAGDASAEAACLARQASLTKPPRSLGRLEALAGWLARWQGRAMPRLDQVDVVVFAGNHGVVAHGVSPYPAAVTAAMVGNFAAGGAAINQLARAAGARLAVHALTLDRPCGDITRERALDEAEFLDAVATGWQAVPAGCDLLCLGEMGIGNTTAAAALCAGLLGGAATAWVGRGTGVDDSGLARKAAAVAAAVTRHRGEHGAGAAGDGAAGDGAVGDARSAVARQSDAGASVADGEALDAAASLGGRELAAILGAALAARHRGVPVLLDGFVCTAAAAPLARMAAGGLDHAMLAHVSAEAGHRALAAALGMAPLLDLGLRLGEGSGAALAVPLLRAALACHAGMATFAEAGVPERDSDAAASGAADGADVGTGSGERGGP
jgi:nicotinate-nucleotide--dimethylbenzimidazole phosphoribosyltransferase